MISPYWSHALQIWLIQSLPEFIIANIIFSQHKGIRKAGLKKLAKLASEGTDKVKST